MADAAGLKVFVVEDETIVAMLLEQMLEELDCEVAGVAGQLSLAMELAHSVDANVAILDLNLSGQRVDPVAREVQIQDRHVRVDPVAQILADRQMPFIFASGYGEDGLAPEWRGRPVLPKPFRLDQLKDALEAATR